MDSRFFPLYQLIGWAVVYLSILLSIYLSGMFSYFEIFFGVVLVASAAFYAHLTRFGYKRWFKSRGFLFQFLYFGIQAVLGASIASLILVISVLILSEVGLISPIASGQISVVVSSVFWGNAANMLFALIAWSAFYLTIVRSRDLKSMAQTLEISQLQSLIQQLNPHFLFNMLNNIRALILEDPEKARDALAKLSDMLRYSLNQLDFNKVKFAEELSMVNEYLELCKIQFESRLKYQFQIADESRNVLIPRMLLQLCVENAIKHGISKLKQGGEISIQAEIKNHYLNITITNPIPAYRDKSHLYEDTERGIGIRNIQERLKLLYSMENEFKETGLTFNKNKEKSEVVVSVTLPVEYEIKELVS